MVKIIHILEQQIFQYDQSILLGDYGLYYYGLYNKVISIEFMK